MIVKQISIFLENRKGRLAEVTQLLGDQNINIRAISLADTSDFGIVRLIVNNMQKAYDILKSAGLTVNKNEVIAVEIPDRPAGLASVLKVLKSAGLNVEYLYGFLEKKTDKAIMIFRFDDMNEALRILKENGVSTITDEELSNL